MHAGGFDNLIIPVQDELLTHPTEESILIRQETSAEESGIVELPWHQCSFCSLLLQSVCMP